MNLTTERAMPTVIAALALPFADGGFPRAQECKPTQFETEYWQTVKDSTAFKAWLAYLDEFPKGCFRKIALVKLDEHLPLHPKFTISFGTSDGGRGILNGMSERIDSPNGFRNVQINIFSDQLRPWPEVRCSWQRAWDSGRNQYCSTPNLVSGETQSQIQFRPIGPYCRLLSGFSEVPNYIK